MSHNKLKFVLQVLCIALISGCKSSYGDVASSIIEDAINHDLVVDAFWQYGEYPSQSSSEDAKMAISECVQTLERQETYSKPIEDMKKDIIECMEGKGWKLVEEIIVD